MTDSTPFRLLQAAAPLKDTSPWRTRALMGAQAFAERARKAASLNEADLERVRRTLRSNLFVRNPTWTQVVLAVLLLGLSSTGVYAWLRSNPSLRLDDIQGSLVISFFLGVTIAAILYHVVWYWVGGYVVSRADLLQRLAPASTQMQRCKETLTLLKHYPQVAQLRDTAVATGRELTVLDLDLMQTLATELQQVELQLDDAQAYRELHQAEAGVVPGKGL